MTIVPLRLGPLTAEGFIVRRSGIRWLCEDGHLCRAGEVIAFCNIGVTPAGRRPPDANWFASEARDFQVAFAPRVGGRLRRSEGASPGGFLDHLYDFEQWIPDFVIGRLEYPPGERLAGCEADGELRLLLLAGRRMTGLAVGPPGLLAGWHDRSRAWWGDGDGARGTVLSLGSCEQVGIIRGERFGFLELFEAVGGPAHAVFVPDGALVPCARFAVEQFGRTPAEFDALIADFVQSFTAGPAVPAPSDWLFAGCLLSTLQKSPLTERYDILTRTGLGRAGPADAIILSLSAELPIILRHRRLGYALNSHGFRVAEAGPAVRAWLRTNFEQVRRTPDDIRRDYLELIDAVRAKSDMKFLIMNVMSTSGDEEIYSYAPFDQPLGDVLAVIRSKELNLMLHDLARERDVSIIDIDAIAAELGAIAHLPDGIHSSGPMQAEVRGEILRVLRARGVPGFGPARIK